MDDYLFYPALFFIGLLILGNAFILAFGVAARFHPAWSQKDVGEERMSILNQLAFSIVALGIGIILAKLFYDDTIGALTVTIAATATYVIEEAVKRFYSKRIPTTDQLETPNRYLPNTSVEAFLDEAEMLSKDPEPGKSRITDDRTK